MQNNNVLENMNLNYPTTIWFGQNRIKEIGKACNALKIIKPLIVTDPGILKVNIIIKIKNFLDINHNIYSGIQSNPTEQNVKNGVDLFIKENHDGVITIGGGSSMDVGKGIAFMAAQKRSIWDFEDISDYWKRANTNVKPIIAIPTTAGTGSETGRAAVFTKQDTQEKKIIFHPKMLPSIVILDPNLTIDLPPSLTAFTGMDALAHCLEAYCSKFFHPLSQGIAIEGVNLIHKNLLRAFADGKNLNARGNMLIAASMGSIAFQKGLGAIHSLSHPIGAIYDLHHGLTNAIFMPYVLKYNQSAIEEKIIALSRYINLPNYSFENFMKWILDLRKKMNIPHSLKELINDDSKFEKMSKMAFRDPSTNSNPLPIKEDNFLELYNDAFEGNLQK